MFRKREKTPLEKQMLDAGIDMQIGGIGRHLFEELFNHGYSNIKINIKLTQGTYMDGIYSHVDILNCENPNKVYAKSWLPYSGNTNEPVSYDRWIIDICDYPGSGFSFMIQSEYSSKYDFKGKLMDKDV